MKILSKIKSLLSKEPILQVTDSIVINGHTFRVLDPFTMPKIRQAAIYMAEYEREWGMTKKDILAYADVMSNATEFPTGWNSNEDLASQLTNKMKRLYALIDTFRLTIQEDFQYKPFLRAACHMILIDGEDPTRIDNDINNRKLKLCSENEETMLFFLRVIRAFQQSTNSSFDISKMWEFYPMDHLLPTESQTLKVIKKTIY